MLRKIRQNFLQLLTTISSHLAWTLAISTDTGETSIWGYKHVVGSFSATDKGSSPSSVADADNSMERTETTDEDETNMFVTSVDIPP
jgi:hypothetical protein